MQSMHLSICISGFTQTERRRHGVYKLSEQIKSRASVCLADRVWLRTWKDNWCDVAEHVWNLQNEYNPENLVVQIFGYSWGGGWGAMQFAKELHARAIPVRHMVLADPVHRHPWLVCRWRSLLSRAWAPSIVCPANVARVTTFHQTQNRPMGHKIQPAHPTQIIEPAVELVRTHQYMDDAPEWHKACLESVADARRQLFPNLFS